MTDFRALQDKQEITELCYRYGLILDRRDWSGLAAVFTPDASAFYLDMPPCHGYQAIEDTCRIALEPMSATQHLISNVVVRLDGDGPNPAATCRPSTSGPGRRVARASSSRVATTTS